MCSETRLFTNISDPPITLNVRVVSDSSEAKGLGTITIDIKDDDGVHHTIKLTNDIYLPQAVEKLISIAQ